MSKRRHSMSGSWDISVKRLALRDHFDAVDDAIDPLIRHYKVGTFNESTTIAHLTRVLDQLNVARGSLLILRSNGLANEGKLPEATSDALDSIDCQPGLIDGYLVAGKLYNTQGKQQAAVDIYERGLRTVLPSDWPLLWEHRELVTKQMNRKLDFVRKLPPEIAAAIFARVRDHISEGQATINQCLTVATHWREFMIQQCPQIWRTINLIRYCGPSWSIARCLPRVANHIRKLSLDYTSKNNELHTLIDMAHSSRLPLLSDLTIRLLPSLFKKHIQLVTLLQGNLTKLKIEVHRMFGPGGSIELALDTIISQCPKLEHLSLTDSCILTNEMHYVSRQPPPRNGYPLKRLFVDLPTVNEILQWLLPRCPRLQVLKAKNLASGTLKLLDIHCPQLRRLGYYTSYLEDDPGRYNLANHDQDPSGLYSINCSQGHDAITRGYIPFLTKSKNTLQTLNLAMVNMFTTENQQIRFEFSKLVTLNLEIWDGHVQLAASLIQQSPMLENVTLSVASSLQHETRNFFTCLATHTQLRRLELSGFDSASSNATGLDQLLIQQAARHQTCKLHDISLEKCNDGNENDDAVLRALTNVTTLRTMTLALSCIDASTASVAEFISRLRTMPYLRYVLLDHIQQITDDELLDMAKIIPELDTLYLMRLYNITSEGVYTLADSLDNLNRCPISFDDCDGVDKDAISYLETKIRGQ